MSVVVKWQSTDGTFSSGTKLKLSEAKALFEKAVKQLQKSTTAKKILDVVNKAKDEIHLVCVPDGEGQFVIPGEIQGSTLAAPTIVWDPNKLFHFYSHGVALSNVLYADESSYQPAIVLIHEMGHCKQWLEGKSAYKSKLDRKDISTIEADNLKRHEAPVAKELGLPIRNHYEHFPNSPLVNKMTVKLRNK